MRSGPLLSLLFVVPQCLAQAVAPLQLSTERNGPMLMVRAAEEGDTTPLLQAIWRDRGTNVPLFDVQRPAVADGPVSFKLDVLLLSAIDRYLDDHVHFGRTGVSVDLPVEQMVQRIDALVNATVPTCAPAAPFKGLSPATAAQLARIAKVDWSQARFGVDGGDDQDKYLAIYFYVRTQRQELERLLVADLAVYAGVELLPATAQGAHDPRYTEDVPTLCRTVMDEEDYLCALDLGVGTSDGLDVALTDEVMQRLSERAKAGLAAAPDVRVRKRDRWLKAELDRINGRIDQLDQRKELWALRDRLDGIEGRLDAMDQRIDERTVTTPVPEENPIAALGRLTGRNIIIAFASGRSTVGPEQQLLLNEVFEQMARSPGDRVLITGHADPVGDPRTNLVLSERRARAVREHLLQRGIAADRLLVNHYGASRGSTAGVQRRVEIEFLR